VLLNGAGRFDDLEEATELADASVVSVQASGQFSQAVPPAKMSLQALVEPLLLLLKRVVVYGSFLLTKQPRRIRQVLEQVKLPFHSLSGASCMGLIWQQHLEFCAGKWDCMESAEYSVFRICLECCDFCCARCMEI
jgi:hypothetical protein